MAYSDDDSYDYYREDEGDFLPEVNILHRGSIENLDTLENIARQAGVNPEERTKNKRFEDKVWRFFVYTNRDAWNLRNKFPRLGLNTSDISCILHHIKDFPNFRNNMIYKNPGAFVLGYVLTKDKKTINMQKLQLIITELPDMITEKPINVKPTDLIRYARLWLRFYSDM
jgi:Family of unknown function (DUF5770)